MPARPWYRVLLPAEVIGSLIKEISRPPEDALDAWRIAAKQSEEGEKKKK